MELVEEEDDVAAAAHLVHDGLEALLELAAVLRAGHEQGHVQRDHAAVAQTLGHIAVGDGLRQALDDGRLADTRLAQQRGVVLGAAAEDLDHPLQLGLAADNRIEIAAPGQLDQIAAEGRQRGRARAAPLPLAALRHGSRRQWRAGGSGDLIGHAIRHIHIVPVLVALLAAEVLEEVFADSLLGILEADVEPQQHLGGHALGLAQEGQKQVLGTDQLLLHGACLGQCQLEDLLRARGVGARAENLRLAIALSHHPLDGNADILEGDAHGVEHLDGHALAEGDKPQQDVLGADVGMVEALGLLGRQPDRFLCAWGEVLHGD